MSLFGQRVPNVDTTYLDERWLNEDGRIKLLPSSHLQMGRITACVGSGLCCTKGPCAFGEVTSQTNPSCRFLEVKKTVEDVLIFKCGKYDYIRTQPGSEWNPAFSAGCCMGLFNDARNKILALIAAGKTELPHS